MKYQGNQEKEFTFVTYLEDSINCSIFRHFKDKNYRILSMATHTETKETFVVYQALYGNNECYIRPAEMFFSKVDKEKYPDVAQEYRFQKIK